MKSLACILLPFTNDNSIIMEEDDLKSKLVIFDQIIDQ